jgi:hypothetical protein
MHKGYPSLWAVPASDCELLMTNQAFPEQPLPDGPFAQGRRLSADAVWDDFFEPPGIARGERD